MPRYRYHGRDARGKTISGYVEAAGPQEALARLIADGYDVEPEALREEPPEAGAEASEAAEEAVTAQPVEELARAEDGDRSGAVAAVVPGGGSGPGRPLSAQQAMELAGHVADLARSQLPLGPGLRAMAEELGDAVLQNHLRRLAGQLDSGADMEEAVAAEANQLPAHLRGMMVAGLRTGRLGEVMEQFVAAERWRREALRRVIAILVYPLLLFFVLLGVMLFFSIFIVPQFRKIYLEFGVSLPPFSAAALWLGEYGGWLLTHAAVISAVLLYAASSLRRPYWIRRVLYAVPLIGPIIRISALVCFARYMKIFLDQRVPLNQSLRLAGAGLTDPALAAACFRTAQRVEAGQSLVASMTGYWSFPPTLLALVRWGQHTASLAEAFEAAAEMYEGNLRLRHTWLAVVLPPLLLLLIAFMVAMLALAVYLPMLRLITVLSG